MAKCPRCNNEITYWTLWNGDNVANFFTHMGQDQYIRCNRCSSECKITPAVQADFARFMAFSVACLAVMIFFAVSKSSESAWEFYHSIAVFLIFGAHYIFWRYLAALEPSDRNKKEK